MKINIEQVEKLAHLARLDLSAKEKKEMVADMDKILGFVEKINELDLDGIEPLTYLTEEGNVMRKDEVNDEVTKEEALKNSPERDTDYFKVPTVVKR